MAKHTAIITIGFSTHRLEVLTEAEGLMMEHDIVALEEPPHPLFKTMLEGDISIEDYLIETEYEFPKFAKASCELYRRLHSYGKTLIQVDPYMEELVRIHQLFANNGSHKDILPDSVTNKVYLAEKKATASLIRFYEVSLSGTFEDLVNAVKDFALHDSQRIKLRDRLRAIALSEVVRMGRSLYVEAGYIHWGLQFYLRRIIHPNRSLKVHFLLEQETKRRTGKRQIFGPGDILTLILMFHPSLIKDPSLDLLAARSLIFVKLLHKLELESNVNFPHLDDEHRAYQLTKALSWNDCKSLWGIIRFIKNPEEAKMIVTDYLKNR
ncbi:MAG: hypothetical protein N2260_01860 [Syntrophobacterales bacterium]|nr:hypothetical protein [Syntrophobacterales bacterium]